jgi:hypothetical protein
MGQDAFLFATLWEKLYFSALRGTPERGVSKCKGMWLRDAVHVTVIVTSRGISCIRVMSHKRSNRAQIKGYSFYPTASFAFGDGSVGTISFACESITAFLREQKLSDVFIDWILDDEFVIREEKTVANWPHFVYPSDKKYAICCYALYPGVDGGTVILVEKVEQAILLQLQLICHRTNTICGQVSSFFKALRGAYRGLKHDTYRTVTFRTALEQLSGDYKKLFSIDAARRLLDAPFYINQENYLIFLAAYGNRYEQSTHKKDALMEQEKLLKTNSFDEYNHMRRWSHFTFFLWSFLFSVLTIAAVWQCYHWYQERSIYLKNLQEISMFDQVAARKKELLDQIAEIEKRDNKESQYREHTKNPLPLIESLLTIKSPVVVNSFSFKKKTVSVKMHGPSIQEIKKWMSEVEKSELFEAIVLDGIKASPGGSGYVSTLRAQVKQ